MTAQDKIREVRSLILEAAAAHGAREIRVFGSVARGEETEGSDVDFLVSLEPGRTLLDLARLELQLEGLLGRRVEVATPGGLPEPARTVALQEAIPV